MSWEFGSGSKWVRRQSIAWRNGRHTSSGMRTVEETAYLWRQFSLYIIPGVCTFARQFNSAVRLTNLSRPGSPEVDGKSMFAVMQSGVSVGHTIRVRAEGPDAQAAITALRALVEQNFPNA